jgi:DNA-binding response OmpR family regulator
MRNRKVLVIDDEVNICLLVKKILTSAGAEVEFTNNPHDALRLVFRYRPDLIILDVMMGSVTGWDVCSQIRQVCDIPIIMLTALDGEQDTVHGLEAGADDFVTKPFRPAILVARARAILRRVTREFVPEEPITYEDGFLTIDIEGRRVFVEGEQIKLTPKEHAVLAYLLQHAGRVRTFEQILEAVWGWEYKGSVGYVHVCISRLRRKLKDDKKSPRYLLTEHGVGYRFEKQQSDGRTTPTPALTSPRHVAFP